MLKSLAVGLLAVIPAAAHGGHHHHHHHHPGQDEGHPEDKHGHSHHEPAFPHHSGHPPHHHHHHMHDGMTSPREHNLMEYVKAECGADVERLCTPQESLPESFGDPFIDWAFFADAPSPFAEEEDDISLMLGQMIDSLSTMPVMTTSIAFIIYEEPEESLDNMLQKLTVGRAPEEIPQLTREINDFGLSIVDSEDVSDSRRRLARRLTEVQPEYLEEWRSIGRLPFRCPENRCIKQALVDGEVSKECQRSIFMLEKFRESERNHEDMIQGMFIMYFVLFVICLVLLVRRQRKARGNRRLKIRILQAIYSNPQLKSQIERELGESVGIVPPLALHALNHIGADGKGHKKMMKRKFILKLVVIVLAVLYLPFELILALCVGLLAVRAVYLLCAPAPVRKVSCCCCGVSTEDIKNGTVSAQQAGCCCCCGTAVCSPTSGCCCCCGPSSPDKTKKDDTKMGSGCCCCCGASPDDAKNGNLTAEQAACCCCCGTGVPAGVRAAACCCCCSSGASPDTESNMGQDGCCCCCCGASPEDAKNGNLTAEQAACCCCCGTGIPARVRAAECGCCCCSGASPDGACCAKTNSKKGKGQKHVIPSKNTVYEGVPLQVV